MPTLLKDDAWIETFTGRRFHILNPDPSEVDIRDIAHALSMIVRFTGHVQRYYSVAEHSWHVSYEVHPDNALVGLLHDASEAYVGDLSRALKHLTPVGIPYLKIEAAIMDAVYERFDLPRVTILPQDVKRADNLLLLAEKAAIMGPLNWENSKGCEVDLTEMDFARGINIVGFSPHVAEKMFLARFDELVAPSPSK